MEIPICLSSINVALGAPHCNSIKAVSLAGRAGGNLPGKGEGQSPLHILSATMGNVAPASLEQRGRSPRFAVSPIAGKEVSGFCPPRFLAVLSSYTPPAQRGPPSSSSREPQTPRGWVDGQGEMRDWTTDFQSPSHRVFTLFSGNNSVPLPTPKSPVGSHPRPQSPRVDPTPMPSYPASSSSLLPVKTNPHPELARWLLLLH